MEGDDFPSIVKVIVTELVTSGMLPAESVEPVTQVLYKRHKHASHITLWDKLKKTDSRGEGVVARVYKRVHAYEHCVQSNVTEKTLQTKRLNYAEFGKNHL